MRKLVFIVTAFISFSTLANMNQEPGPEINNDPIQALQKDVLRKESKTKSVVSVESKEDRSTKPLYQAEKNDRGNISINRRQVIKKDRPITKEDTLIDVQKYRPESPKTASNFDDFTIFDSWISLDYDSDGDGYYSEFTLNFDADFSGGHVDVFADIYLSREGGAWVLVHTTDIFSIFSSNSDDFYSTSLGLRQNFQTAEYDILIDLFEVSNSGIVATAGPLDDSDLFALPLEDMQHELNNDNTLITFVASELSFDADLDGYYTQLTLEYDIDTFDSGRIVYAEVNLTDALTLHSRTVSTEDFLLGNQTEFIDLVFSGGYTTSLYDVEISLIDVHTNEVLAIAAQDFSSLTQLPIESEEFDEPPTASGGHVAPEIVVDVHGSGGGSMGITLLVLSLFGVVRRYTQGINRQSNRFSWGRS